MGGRKEGEPTLSGGCGEISWVAEAASLSIAPLLLLSLSAAIASMASATTGGEDEKDEAVAASFIMLASGPSEERGDRQEDSNLSVPALFT